MQQHPIDPESFVLGASGSNAEDFQRVRTVLRGTPANLNPHILARLYTARDRHRAIYEAATPHGDVLPLLVTQRLGLPRDALAGRRWRAREVARSLRLLAPNGSEGAQ